MRELPWPRLAAALPLAGVAAVLTWWGLKSGAYFGVVFIPGTILLLSLLGLLVLFAPWPARLAGSVRLALVCLLVLVAWTLISGLWSSAPDIAVSDAQRVLGYATLFGLGVWLCLLLGRRLTLALLPLVTAGAGVGVATLVVVWTGSRPGDFLELDATLRYPLGYRNAEAAFFLICLLPTVVLAARRELDWRVRGALAGSAALSIELAVLAQSRASPFAAAAAVVILLLAHPFRLRTGIWLGAAVIPAAIALPWLLDVYGHGGGNTEASIPPLHAACRAMALTTLLAAVTGAVLARLEPDLRMSSAARRAAVRTLLGVASAALLIGASAVLISEGGPGGVIDRADEELMAGTPDLQSQGSRFGVDFRTGRGDFWRVALDDAVDHPIGGEGAGGFRHAYLLHRDEAGVQPEDPHSVELLMASELGVPGLLLFVGFAAGATVAVLRVRRLGPTAGVLAAPALAVATYWLVHASVDWFWSYPAVTAPVVFALGAAAAPICLRPEPAALSPRLRFGLAGAAAVAALSMVPFFLSQSYANRAIRNSDEDAADVYRDLDRAADLDPLSTVPLLGEAAIAERNGDPDRALSALDEAEQRQPDQWEPYYLEARVLAPVDLEAARTALREADDLNPHGAEIDTLAAQLGVSAPPSQN